MTSQTGALRLALVQANPTVGDFEGNIALVKRHVLAHKDADIVVFSECFVTGYSLEDLVLRPNFLAKAAESVADLASWLNTINGPAVLIGAPIAGADLPYNAAHLITPDGAIKTITKVELPNADVFDERRTFAHGVDPKPLAYAGWRLGGMICEDMWHGRVTRDLIDELVDILIVINGSPFELDKQPIRIGHARERVRTAGKPLVYLNMVGGQDELVFDGASFVLDAKGVLIAQMPAFAEGVLRLTFSHTPEGTNVVIDDQRPLVDALPDRLESAYAACVAGLRDYVEKNGFPHVILGVSGGLDSALVAAMAVDALGPDRVIGVMMPTKYTSKESLDLANDLFKRLGCRSTTIDIDAVYASFEDAMGAIDAGSLFNAPVDAQMAGLASENFQPRTRGTLLMGLSNKFGGLVLSTGNKSEMSVGYATLYGDMCGGFNPIKDLYKTTAFALCRWRNANKRTWMKGGEEPITPAIIARPPTAELKPDQTDEKALGSYDLLDTILKLLIEDLCDPEEARLRAVKKLGQHVDLAYVRKIAALVKRAEYKRRQAPPGVKLTSRSFGKGWRYPITNHADL